MKVGDLDLKQMLEFAPDQGTVKLGKDRMLIFRQDAFGALRRLLYEVVGDQQARALLSQFGYRCGKGDFTALNAAWSWDTEMDRMSCGPVLHTWEGIVHVEPTMLEFDRDKGHFHMTGIWRNSYEAELHLAQEGRGTQPVCHTLTGYASGWCEGFFGKPTLAVETACVGCGDPHCAFEVRAIDDWDERAEHYKQALISTPRSIARELEEKLVTIERQAQAIRELSTPVMEIWDDVLVLPIVGVVDTRRSMEIMNTLLERIVAMQSRCVIIDITGVEVVDTKTADYLLRVSRAASLLGSRCVLTGLSPAVAQTLVEIGADLTEVRTLRNLKEGLRDCLKFLKEK
jgi:rsbT co-antagonist protein RsbR